MKITLNGKIIDAKEDSILNVALENDIHIPHFCYDDRMEAFGGCGMCVVEIEGSNKLVRSCSQNIREGMVITTHTDRTERARKVAMDLYVSDHRGDCIAPCKLGCPATTDVQGYVGLISNGQPIEATKLIKESIPIPSAIGRICPAPCESECRRGVIEEPISIAQLKYYASDQDLFSEHPYIPECKPDSGKSVGIVGAGAAGLSIAYFLAELGHKPVVYEMMPAPGGMLRYGIPEYRLPNDVIDRETKIIEQMGAEFHYNTKLGDDITLEELRALHDAVFVGIGAWKAGPLRAKNDQVQGVYGGIDFLREVVLGERTDIGQKVLVIGGGNTAMDVCRTAVRLGASDVKIIYRRTLEEMPAQPIEITEAMEEGVSFEFLYAQTEVLSEDGVVTGLRCEKMELGEPDVSGRRKPVGTGTFVDFEADAVIAAIGQKVDMGNIQGLSLTEWGTIDADAHSYATNLDGVFAGGDVVTGPKDAVDAVGAAKYASKVIDSYLNGALVPYSRMRLVERHDMTKDDFPRIETTARAHNKHVAPDIRRTNFEAMGFAFEPEVAVNEATRCLECGCDAYYDCDLLDGIREYKIDTAKEYRDEHRHVLADIHDFISLDNDKCVQCSLCVRVCQDLVGATALGLVNRGYDGFVAPEFEGTLRESSCVSCGACIEVCPTGAFSEKTIMEKPIPLDFDEVHSVCTQCDLGCEVTYHMKGDRIYKVTPHNEAGVLCKDGKFGFEYIQDHIEQTGEIFNLGSKVILLSPVLSNEEVELLEQYAEEWDASILITECASRLDEETNLKQRVEQVIYGKKHKVNAIGVQSLNHVKALDLNQYDTVIYIGNELNDIKDIKGNILALSANKDLQQKVDAFIPMKDMVYYNCTFVKQNGETVKVNRIIDQDLPLNTENLHNFITKGL